MARRKPKPPWPAQRRARRCPGGGRRRRRASKFGAALDAFNAHDKANDWNDQTCSETAKLFLASASAQSSGKFPEARTTPGSPISAAANDKDAKARFQTSLGRRRPKFHFARAQLALYQFKADGNVDAAISALEQAVTDANFQNVPALVDLAMFQMQRDSEQVGANCHAKAAGKDVDLPDFDCAKLNLQRALAIDDGYMPAFNQLALYYFGSAKKKAGGGKKFGRTIATNAAHGQARRRATARPRGARVLAGCPEEPELRADPQHVRPHPKRAWTGELRP